MITGIRPEQLQDKEVLGPRGDRIGTAHDTYFDDRTGAPAWVAVKTGKLGGSSLVPLAEASLSGSAVVVPYTKDEVKASPQVSADGQLSADEVAQLYAHYGLAESPAPQPTEPSRRAPQPATPEPQVASGDDAMTRSEEQLRVGVEDVETGRAKLRKYVTTENVQTEVPVARERARIEREPITETNVDQALAGRDITESEHEVVLHEQRPVVSTETVPVERVRLATDVEQDTETVRGQVRTEHIDVSQDESPPQRPGRRS